MPTTKAARQSVTLSARIEKRIRAIARARRSSKSQVVAELIEAGLQAKLAEKRRFFELADRLTHSSDPAEQQEIKKQLASMTFGD